ncbi:MAG: biotin transporter BioY [Clostridiales bacterium]|jgi:biotin transport system substrate-specific component|nr:biotin transporter BioY [Eubacteriales bacterium]MDH7566418.1 biotin transporter BioY [Clostridiales bacterium]
MKLSTKQMIVIGLFTAITAIFSQISLKIPLSPVPVTLQTLAVFLSAIILGSKCGMLSQIVYILIGAAGVPVFSNFESGIGVLFGYKGGFLISFPIMAYVMGLILEKRKRFTPFAIVPALTAGMAVCYTIGAFWLALVLKTSAVKAVTAAVIPFIPFDLVKIIIAAILGYQVRNSLIKTNLLA